MRRALAGVRRSGEAEANAEDRRGDDGGVDDVQNVAAADVSTTPRADEPAERRRR